MVAGPVTGFFIPALTTLLRSDKRLEHYGTVFPELEIKDEHGAAQTAGIRCQVKANCDLCSHCGRRIPHWPSANVAEGADFSPGARRSPSRLCKLQSTLASATLLAGRGEYEIARQTTSEFFTSLYNQVHVTGGVSDLTPPQRDTLRALLNDRDNLITLLARRDPAAADRLSDLLCLVP